MPSPQYQFKITASASGPGGLQNVELLTDGERYFYAPVLVTDYRLRQPAASGAMIQRGYQQFVWQSDVWRGQYAYLYGTILQGSLSGPVYFQTLRLMHDASYSVWLGTLTLPLFDAFNRNYRQYQNMQWTFTRCTQVP